jgi:serine/threonine protein kinase
MFIVTGTSGLAILPDLLLPMYRGNELVYPIANSGGVVLGLVDNLPSFVSEQLPIAVAQRPLVAPSTLVALDAAFAEFMQLTDFGVFGTLNPRTGVTRSGQMFGTPTYMSPEQIRGQKQSSLGGHFKTGQSWSAQNRPTD